MSASRKLIGIASTLVILGLTQTGFAANNQTLGSWMAPCDGRYEAQAARTRWGTPVALDSPSRWRRVA